MKNIVGQINVKFILYFFSINTQIKGINVCKSFSAKFPTTTGKFDTIKKTE